MNKSAKIQEELNRTNNKIASLKKKAKTLQRALAEAQDAELLATMYQVTQELQCQPKDLRELLKAIQNKDVSTVQQFAVPEQNA